MDLTIAAPQDIRCIDGYTALVQKFLLNFVDLQYDELYSLRNNKTYLQGNSAATHAHAWSDALRVKHKLAEYDPVWRSIHVKVRHTDIEADALKIQITLTFTDGAEADVSATISGWVEPDEEKSAAVTSESDGDGTVGLSTEVERTISEQDSARNPDD